jgi:drug/metabolite transporter (DMT)-like permease
LHKSSSQNSVEKYTDYLLLTTDDLDNMPLMPSSPPPAKLYLILTAGVVAVSLAAIFIRYAQAPSLVVAAYRMTIASLVLLPLTLPALRKTPLNKVNAPYALLAGVFLGVHFATWISSLSFTTVAASAAIVATQPLWVALFSWLFLKTPPSFVTLLGVLVSIGGMAMIGFGDFSGGSRPLLGDGLALIGGICAAAYFLLGRSAQKRGLGINAYVGVAYSTAALVLLPLPLLQLLFTSSAASGQTWTGLLSSLYFGYPVSSFFWIVLLALIPQLIGHTSFNYAVRFLPPTLVSTLLLLEPVGAAVLAVILFREIPGVTTLIGSVFLLVGVAITIHSSRPKSPTGSSQEVGANN